MKRLRLAAVAVSAMFMPGCQSGSMSTTQAKPASAAADCPEDFNVAGMQKGKATYHAEQVRDAVMIHAEGTNPTGGWQNGFTLSRIEIFPPQYTFNQKRPDGPATQQITPFTACVKFKAGSVVKEVRVFDADGEHTVKVDQAQE